MINYVIHTLITIGYYSILVVSLNLALGYTGIINLGHVAFFAIGAYTSALLTLSGIPFVLAFFLSAVVAGFFGYFLTVLTNRLKGDYVALATLGFSFIIGSILLNWTSLTKGALGVPGIEKPNIFGYAIIDNIGYLIFTWVVALSVYWIMYRIVNSRYGTLLQAVRDDAIGLTAFGKNIFKLKYQAMMVSAGMAGIAGSLFAHYITYIHPTNFYLPDIIFMLSMVIVGGLASLRGSIVATFVLGIITEMLRFIDLPSHVIGPSRLMIYTVILIVVLLYKPRGFFGKVDLH